MPITAEVVADTVCPPTGCRVTSFLLTYPRFIHAEVMTHRVFSRNSASSRAVPLARSLKAVVGDPATPVRFGSANRGMQDAGPLGGWRGWAAARVWAGARYPAVAAAWALGRLGVHKQIANRVVEPWAHMTALVTATEWGNWYRLRTAPDAQPEMQVLARTMLAAHAASSPRVVGPWGWHLPFAAPDELLRLGVTPSGDETADRERADAARLELVQLVKRCTARAARTSYVNFRGKDDPADDLRLHDQLAASGHWSPFEHCCQAAADGRMYGNLRGFVPYRKTFAGESGAAHPFDPAAFVVPA